MKTGTNVMVHDYSRKTTYAVRRVLPEAKESTSTLSNDFSKGNSYASTKYIEWLEDKEGFRAKVYNDGVGVPTIGYGCTAAVTSILGFNPISKGTCTQLEAEQWLIKILNYYGEILKKKLKVLNVSLVQCKVDALLDACYYSPSWLYNNNHNLWKLIKGEKGITAKQAFASLLGSNALSGNFTRANQLADMWTKGTYTKGY
ncbi:glycoside hydrolase family protein, partial [Clostridium neonatale]|nr:lysozyme [Clostridium neonatale]